LSAQQDVAIVEDGLAGGAGRAEAGVAAIVFDFMCLCEHGRGLLFTEKLLGFIGSKERDDIIDAADIGFKLVYTITLFFLKWVDECKEKVYYTI